MGTHPIFESDFDCLTVMISRANIPFSISNRIVKSSRIIQKRSTAIQELPIWAMENSRPISNIINSFSYSIIATIFISGSFAHLRNNEENLKKFETKLRSGFWRGDIFGYKFGVLGEIFIFGSILGLRRVRGNLKPIYERMLHTNSTRISPVSWIGSAFNHESFAHFAIMAFPCLSFSSVMSSNETMESWLLGAVWSAAVFSIIGQLRRAPKFYVGGGGAIMGVIGHQVYSRWNDEEKVTLNYPFQEALITYPNIAINMARAELKRFGILIPEFQIREAYTFQEYSSLFICTSLFLALVQIIIGGRYGVVAHTGHLGGMAGGAIGAHLTHNQIRFM